MSHQNLYNMYWSLIPRNRDARILSYFGSTHGTALSAKSRVWLIFPSWPDTGWLVRVSPANDKQHCQAARTDVRKRRWCVMYCHHPVTWPSTCLYDEDLSICVVLVDSSLQEGILRWPRIISEVLDNHSARDKLTGSGTLEVKILDTESWRLSTSCRFVCLKSS